jgi:uncharacterized protein YjbJ (UPF0337 family)
MDEDRVVGAVKGLAGKAEKTVGDAIGDRATQAKGAATEAEGGIQNAFGQAKDAARGAADAAADVASQAYDKGSAVYQQGTQLVSERPASALLTAGLIGFALGIIVARGSQPPRRPRWQRLYYE